MFFARDFAYEDRRIRTVPSASFTRSGFDRKAECARTLQSLDITARQRQVHRLDATTVA